MNRISIFTLLVFLLIGNTALKAGELVIITHIDNQQSLSLDEVKRIFLGKQRNFSDGSKVTPIHLPTSDKLYQIFSEQILQKSSSQLRAYWAKRIFTGKGRPPINADNQGEAKMLVSKNRHYISYIASEQVDESIQSVIIFKLD